ncbi:MAG: fluoride efflux transporter CrcB [Cyanobacteria bacterium P01_A01_bin.135]
MLNLAVRAPLAVALGAIIGALGRYYFSHWLNPGSSGGFPTGTFVVNMGGCLLIGAVAALSERLAPSPELRLLVITGGLGAFTTFSTYSLESVVLLQRGRLAAAGLYWLGSALLGPIILYAGLVLGEQLGPRG